MMRRTAVVLVLAWLALACACDRPSAASARSPDVPPGQVWLTADEVRKARIELAAVGENVVDGTVLTAGAVMLDDQRSGHVFSPVTGRVTRILARLGDQVRAGDPLAVIESPDVGQAVSDVHKAEADLVAAEHDLQRKRDLMAQKAAAAADVEASEDAERNAKAELERARLKQFLLRSGHLDAVSQTYTIRSPVGGEVLLWNITPGMEVQGQYSGGASAPATGSLASTTNPGELFTIGEVDKVWVLGDVYEIDLPRVAVGQKVRLTTLAYPDRTFAGTVDWVSGGLDPNTRTAKVRCTIDNPERLLRPMMYTTVSISVDERKAVAIPRSAIVKMGEYKVVFVEVGTVDGQIRVERTPIDVSESKA
ncbi:MAG: efflux RND transporter periplasmic adaptor subunit, partial [Myxococcales bacterium]|nr:efflux RND transporter periplasmic adaptor subunit [Myxococcales bacterium]